MQFVSKKMSLRVVGVLLCLMEAQGSLMKNYGYETISLYILRFEYAD